MNAEKPANGAAVRSTVRLADLELEAETAWANLTLTIEQAVKDRAAIDRTLSVATRTWDEAYRKLKDAKSANAQDKRST